MSSALECERVSEARRMPEIFEISMDGPIDLCEVDGVGVVGINLGGSLPPLFCVRTWSEELEGYRRLARHLGP